MLKVIAEQEHYLLISDGQRFTVVDDETVAELIRQSGSYSERDAQRRLVEVASQWRELCEHVR